MTYSKAKKQLNWSPKTKFKDLVRIMVDHDFKRLKRKMIENSSIYVAGHKGMVGSAIVRILRAYGYKNIITSSSNALDLRIQIDVEKFFRKHKPEYVFIAAAKVGGILANNNYRADFIYDNIMIQSNLINACKNHDVIKTIF